MFTNIEKYKMETAIEKLIPPHLKNMISILGIDIDKEKDYSAITIIDSDKLLKIKKEIV